MANLILNKESGENDIRNYFKGVLSLLKSNDEFPVSLDDVWMLVYPRKDHAVRSLKENFMEGVDYQAFPKNGERSDDGRFTGGGNDYHLTVPCLEFFIARKVRPVFEIYRQVFHKAVEEKTTKLKTNKENNMAIEASFLRAQASLTRANEAKARLLLEIANSDKDTTFSQVCRRLAVNTVCGDNTVALPEAGERTYSADEIAKQLGTNKNVIGRLAAKHDMKTPEYGKWFHDKSPYSNKEVSSFRYFKNAIAKFDEIMATNEITAHSV